MAESIAAGFDRTLNFTPQISVDSVVIVAANTPVLELVTPAKAGARPHSMDPHLALQHKRPRTGSHLYRQGGLRSQASHSHQHRSTNALRQCGPSPPKLLSLGMGDVRVLQDEDGLLEQAHGSGSRSRPFARWKRKRARHSPNRICSPKPGSRLKNEFGNLSIRRPGPPYRRPSR